MGKRKDLCTRDIASSSKAKIPRNCASIISYLTSAVGAINNEIQDVEAQLGMSGSDVVDILPSEAIPSEVSAIMQKPDLVVDDGIVNNGNTTTPTLRIRTKQKENVSLGPPKDGVVVKKGRRKGMKLGNNSKKLPARLGFTAQGSTVTPVPSELTSSAPDMVLSHITSLIGSLKIELIKIVQSGLDRVLDRLTKIEVNMSNHSSTGSLTPKMNVVNHSMGKERDDSNTYLSCPSALVGGNCDTRVLTTTSLGASSRKQIEKVGGNNHDSVRSRLTEGANGSQDLPLTEGSGQNPVTNQNLRGNVKGPLDISHRQESNLVSGSKASFKSFRIGGTVLDLPPVATPLVAVLVRVPPLKSNCVETTEELIRKVMFWCSGASEGGKRASKHVIMARRVAWVGNGTKTEDGDCIVINFGQKEAAGWLLNGCHSQAMEGIIVLPLAFFYPPTFAVSGRDNMGPQRYMSGNGLRRSNSLVTPGHIPLFRDNYPVQTYDRYGGCASVVNRQRDYRCVTSNRFAPLTQLDNID